MEKSQRSRRGPFSLGDAKVIALFVMALCVFCVAGWAFLNKGLYLLPEKMCEGALDRSAVKRVLPSARAADSGSGTQGAGYNFTFSCRVTTSDDSILTGRAQVQQISLEKWLEHYRGTGEEHQILRVSAGDVQALAQTDSAGASSVYIPCAPSGVPAYNASRPYAVVGETSVYGQAKGPDASLRQNLTDIAYRLTRHAYETAECKAPRAFPEELPRFQER
ncbi:hypothetical protein [Streptomyces sp. SID10815]|uniref:hypothetical protein n=1 Tax=Streptomyces sp. SID10815 TaxID=2706027 RepID=UPI0013C76344|nr:hypothetical protein [Streptomyces sp. SID10815]NEA49166.1 hypothetical protein [Streptomyces sp. SID10815]